MIIYRIGIVVLRTHSEYDSFFVLIHTISNYRIPAFRNVSKNYPIVWTVIELEAVWVLSESVRGDIVKDKQNEWHGWIDFARIFRPKTWHESEIDRDINTRNRKATQAGCTMSWILYFSYIFKIQKVKYLISGLLKDVSGSGESLRETLQHGQFTYKFTILISQFVKVNHCNGLHA